MRRYNIINNTAGWLCFLIAAVTYLLTIEPTASFWDCPEFITQGFKLEVGHPPGNPIFMLTARFFVTLFGGGAETAAIAVNSMSALLSAGTILLLFWTITHLAKKLMVRDTETTVSGIKTAVIMAAGVCGALAYTWSDTFWFSAVEGEVYAFSSFCTALVFWLILKWENRADNPGSDRYLLLIAYIIGISIAVHLLNLLCIPAIVLVIYYKKFSNTNVVGSLIALAISAAIVALILFGLVPGFIAVAQRFEVLCVNTLHMSYNMGVLIYAIITVAVFIWTIYELRRQDSAWRIKAGVLASIILSGMPFIGHGWFIPVILVAALVIYLYGFCPSIPVRIFNLVIMSIFVIFIGYSSYALLLIRSTSNTPMNQNAPDNVFSLASYLNREQYGDTPLLTGPKLSETIRYEEFYDDNNQPIEYVLVNEYGDPQIELEPVGPRVYMDGELVDHGRNSYAKVVKASPDEPDSYVKNVHTAEYEIPSGMKMMFPRMYSDMAAHVEGYKTWSLYEPDIQLNVPQNVKAKWAERGYATRQELERYITNIDDAVELTDEVAVGNRRIANSPIVWQPTVGDNLKYFFNYQLHHMYWRYFMWNFAGRQNDIPGNGEPHKGNWISGYGFIDNWRLGDQSLLPEEYTTANPGHNVFYLLPLLLGILGIIWQSLMKHPAGEKRGIEQFWVIFFLFFMTGIAIVLYLNQPPGQPRERDYAFAGSFYAFAIWIGLGIPALYTMLRKLIRLLDHKKEPGKRADILLACTAAVVAVAVPLQMVSQTWDDHDRSGRYAARDFGMNYLNSLEPNAIIFVNGDNDTFPLWYCQEVEGCRTDVKVVNLSYLSQDWYARQIAAASYDAAGVPFYMPFVKMNYGSVSYYPTSPRPDLVPNDTKHGMLPADKVFDMMYKRGPQSFNKQGKLVRDEEKGYYFVPGFNVEGIYVPLKQAELVKRFGLVPESLTEFADSLGNIVWELNPLVYLRGGSGSQFANLLTYEIITRSAMDGFKRPVYFASTVGDNYYMGFGNNMYTTGMALQVTPFNRADYDPSPVAAKAYDNIVGKFRWGGLDAGRKIYLDETVRRMVSSTRLAILSAVNDLLDTPDTPAPEAAVKLSKEKGLPVPATYADMARNLMDMMMEKMPVDVAPLENGLDLDLAKAYIEIAYLTGNVKDLDKARKMLTAYADREAKLLAYAASLNPEQLTHMRASEMRNLYYSLAVLGTLDYADMTEAAIKGLYDYTDMTAYNNYAAYLMSGSEAGMGIQRMLYIDQVNLNNPGTDDYEIAEVAQVFAPLYSKAGIKDSAARGRDFFRKAGITPRQWVDVVLR